jgi:hypothetical protein
MMHSLGGSIVGLVSLFFFWLGSGFGATTVLECVCLLISACAALSFLVGVGFVFWHYLTCNIIGRLEYLFQDPTGRFHRHCLNPVDDGVHLERTDPHGVVSEQERYRRHNFTDATVAVEVWLGGWFRKDSLVCGCRWWIVKKWDGKNLSVGYTGYGPLLFRHEWFDILPLLRNDLTWPRQTELEMSTRNLRIDRLTREIESVRKEAQKDIESARGDEEKARTQVEDMLVQLLVLVRLTGKGDPLGWGRSRHGAQINARVLAMMEDQPAELLESLQPRVEEALRKSLLASGLPTGTVQDPPADK